MDSLEAAALRADSAALFQQGATFRRAVNAIAFTWSGAPTSPLCGAFTSLTRRRDIEGGGFEVQPDAVLRVQRSAFPAFTPDLGHIVTVQAQRFKITAVAQPVASNDEWRLDLGKA